ncbi:MAG TPA: ACT domain-containing protein [Phycisphaerae bacterium]|nr:ACT domain-containing protein [Phycisphaerae bacterium]HNU44690.1 ACT domain-containing protein [Phycisphaerae bacterium]
MPKTTQFCVSLDNKPGALARLCTSLKKAKVNIEAIALSDNGECGWVRLVVKPIAAAKTALEHDAYHFLSQHVLVLEPPPRPGVLAQITGTLAKAGVNINYVYGSSSEEAAGILVLSVTDVDRAAEALGEA